MDFSLYFPIWDKLTPDEQRYLSQNILFRKVTKGTVIHNGNISCTGLLLVGSGQLRSYMLSEDGRELTLYRLFEHDMCLFSAACMMTSLQFEVIIEAEKDTELWGFGVFFLRCVLRRVERVQTKCAAFTSALNTILLYLFLIIEFLLRLKDVVQT